MLGDGLTLLETELTTEPKTASTGRNIIGGSGNNGPSVGLKGNSRPTETSDGTKTDFSIATKG
jgi:hypothetical protein